jgi:hypothetical protein
LADAGKQRGREMLEVCRGAEDLQEHSRLDWSSAAEGRIS